MCSDRAVLRPSSVDRYNEVVLLRVKGVMGHVCELEGLPSDELNTICVIVLNGFIAGVVLPFRQLWKTTILRACMLYPPLVPPTTSSNHPRCPSFTSRSPACNLESV